MPLLSSCSGMPARMSSRRASSSSSSSSSSNPSAISRWMRSRAEDESRGAVMWISPCGTGRPAASAQDTPVVPQTPLLEDCFAHVTALLGARAPGLFRGDDARALAAGAFLLQHLGDEE